MAGDPKYGSSRAGFGDAIARMGAQEGALNELAKKERALAEAEGASTKGQGANVKARGDSVAAIQRQVAALSEAATAIGRETSLLGANTAAWKANATQRERALTATTGAAAPGGVAAAPTGGGRYGASSVGFKDAIASTQAQTSAVTELEAKTARLAATQAAAAAAAQRMLQSPPGIPPSLYRQTQAALPPGGQRLLPAGPPIYGPETYLGQPGALRLGEQPRGGPFVAGPGGLERTTSRTSSIANKAGAFDTAAIGEYTSAEQQAVKANEAVRASIAGVGAEQLAANAAFRQSVAEYASSSQALQRHGALSTEFIHSLARGEVTLAEFGTALTSTIGKFAGWAVAGGLVYGAFEALKRVTEGATSTATGVAQLERAIPDLNRREAEEGFRTVGQRINVPIHQVAEAQFYAARAGFHDQKESLAVGETAILAEKLDQVPIQEATKSLGALKIAFGLNAAQIRTVFNELDVGQLKFNARLNQTLPQMGRAASAFANAGGTAHQLATQLVEVVGATGGGGGQGGGNPATFLLREPTNLARPAAIQTLRQFGFDPKQAAEHIGRFNEELQERAKSLNEEQKRELAKAIGAGGAQGGRYGIALIQAGPSGRAAEVRAGLTTSAGAADEDLKHKLSQFNEEFASIGHTFERVGSELGRSGVTQAAEAFIAVLRLMSEGFEKAVRPLTGIGQVVGAIPAPLQDALAAGALGLGATRFARSGKGIGLSRAAGEVPGLGFLDSGDKKALRDLNRTTSEGITAQRAEVERAAAQNRAAKVAAEDAVAEKARFAQTPYARQQQGLGISQRSPQYDRQVALYDSQIEGAKGKSLRAEENLRSARGRQLAFEEDELILQNRQLSVRERITQLAARGAVAAPAGVATNRPLQGAFGPVGTAYEARSGIVLPAGVAVGGKAVGESLDRASINVKEGGAAVEQGFAGAATQIKAGGAAVADAFAGVAVGTLGLGGAAAAARGGAGAIFGGTALGAGALFSKIGPNLLKGFFTAYIGAAIAEIAGSAVTGITGSKGVGKAVGGIGADVAVGAGLGTLIGNPVLGGILGGIYGAGKQIGGVGGDAAVGAGIGFVAGGPLGAVVGGGAGALLGLLTQGGPQANAAKLLREQRAALRGGGETHAEHLETVAEEYGQELEIAFKNEGEAAQKAKGQIEKRLRVVAATLKLFGQTSNRGRAVQEELQASTTASIEYLLKNPANLDQATGLIEKQQEVGLKQSKGEFDRSLKGARSPDEVIAAQRRLEQTNQGIYQYSVPTVEKGFTEKIKVAQDEQAATEAQLKQALATPTGSHHVRQVTQLKARLDANRKEVESLGRLLKEFHEAAPQLIQPINELNEEAAEGAYKKLGEQEASGNALKLAQAGNNSQAKLRAEQQIESAQERNTKTAYKGKYPVQEGKLRDEQAAQRVQREQRQAQEKLEQVELGGARRIAELPVGAPKAAAAEIRVQTERARIAIIKKNHDNAFSHKQLEEAETKLLEADKAREEAVQAEASEMISLKGQIAQALNVGNAIGQASAALGTANQLLGIAKTPKDRLQAQLGIINAQNQLAKAQQDHIKQQGDYEASLTGDPLAKERIALRTDRRLLGAARGPDERLSAQTTLNNALRSYTTAVVSNKEQEIDFHKQLGEISNQTAIEQYKSLLKLHGLTTRERQDVLLKIHALQNELGTGNNQVFNAAPGSIKLPTAIDVRKAISAAGHAGSIIHSPTENHSQTNQFIITVHDSRDIGKVADTIDRALGSGVKARLRAAGYRGN